MINKKYFSKCLITLGLLLFLTLLIPFTSYSSGVAYANSNTVPEKEKNDYRLNLKSITLVKGKSQMLKVYPLGDAKVSFKSDDSEIASVSEDGIVTGNKVGATNITVTVKDTVGITNLTCSVTIGPPAISVKWTQSRIILGIEKSEVLRVILKPSNTTEDAKFYSDEQAIVSITTGGRITAKGYGMTTVIAQIDTTNPDGSNKKSECCVIVTSQDNAPLLEAYFNEHPELALIPEYDLNAAFLAFFNSDSNTATTTNLVDSLNRYLNKLFDLEYYKKAREEAISKISSNSIEIVVENTSL